MPDSPAPDQATAPTVFVLFGATGDLAKRMVLPAFFALAQHGLLPERWVLVGNGRRDVSHEEFRIRVHDALEEFGPKPQDGPWEEFASRLRFAGGGFAEDDPGSLLDVLAEARTELDADGGDSGDVQYVHYLSLPPATFADMTRALGAHGLAEGARVVYEKPFGTSPEDFRALDEVVHATLSEEQVFRIDHFLGKEGTQNLHALRFGNTLFSSAWDRQHIKAVQIDVPETLDIADRADFYDATGALLDMVVTHLFQIAAEVAMEPPTSMSAEDLQQAREDVIGCFRPLAQEEVVLGQFEGYRETDGVDDASQTDTFVAARLWVDNERWEGVPFLLRTGKQLAESAQRVSLIFASPPDEVLQDQLPPLGNVLTISLAGSGSVDLRVVLKKPGADYALTCAETELPLGSIPGGDPLPPYVKLLHDVLRGDRSLFTRPDGLASAWDVIAGVLDTGPEVRPYPRGSWGPQAADDLAAPNGWLLRPADRD